ncbi:hypothetical protein YC2023_004428 [Brassica napus]
MDSARWPFPWTVRYTKDVRGCLWLSMCVRQHTQDVRGCPYVHISARCTHRTSLGVRQDTQDVSGCPSAHTGRPTLFLGLSMLALPVDCLGHFGPRGLSVQYTQDVRQHTQDVRGCPPAHTGRPWLSISTHISTLVLGLSTLALPVDCLGDFGPRGLFVQYTQDVCGCPTPRTSVAVRVYPSAHIGHSWLTHRTSVAVRVCSCVSISTHRTSVAVHHRHRTSMGVRQHTLDVCGCSWLSVCVRVCPSAHTGRLWLSISTHISTLVLGLSTLANPMECSGDFDPRWLSVQYTKDVCGCPSAHIGRPWVSVSTHRTFVAVRVCPCMSVSTHMTFVAYTQDVRRCPPAHTRRPWLCVAIRQYTQDVCGCPLAHTGRLWLSVRTHKTSLVVHLYTYQHAGPWTQHAGTSRGLFGTFLGVRQHTQDVCGCPCVSVCVRQHTQDVVAIRVCPSAHTRRLWLSISTHISTLALPLDCSGDFGPRGLSVQYTKDVCGCPSAHIGRPWVSVSTHRTFVAVRVCPCMSVSTHMTFVAYTQDVRRCPPAHTRRPWLCVAIRQYTQDVCGCPLAHTGRLWLSVRTHKTSLVVHLYTYQHAGPWTQHAGTSRGLFGTFLGVRQHTQDVCGCPCVSVCVRQHTQDVVAIRVCPSAHTRRLWLSIIHIGRPRVSASTHKTSVAVCCCPSVHTGRPWLSVAVRVCPWLFVCVRQHTQDVRGCPSVHISARWSLDSAGWPFPWTVWVNLAHVGCLFSKHRTSVGVRQHTQHVRGCPSAHTGRQWLSVCVRVCPSAHTGRPYLPVCVRQHTQDVRGCPSVHISARWSLDSARWPFTWTVRVILAHVGCLFSTHRTSVGVRQHTQDVYGCPFVSVFVRVLSSAHTGRPWLSISTHIRTLVLGLSTLTLPMDCSGDFGPRGLSVQNTQDVRGCPPAHTRRPWLSVAICQYKQDVCGCPLARTGRPWLSVCVRQHTQDVPGCPFVHISARWSLDSARWPFPWTVQVILAHVGCLFSTHRTSAGVRQHTQDVRGCLWLSVCVRQHTHDVRGCQSVHISARWSLDSAGWSLDSAGWPFPWTVRVILAHVGCLFSTHRTSVGVRQHTQDVRGCPCVSVCVRVCLCVSVSTQRMSVAVRVCSSVSVSTHRTFVAVHQYTYQHAGPWTQHADPSRGLFGTHRTSAGVRQHTQEICGCLWLSVSTHRTSVAVRVCPSAHTRRPWLSICPHISTLVLGLSTLALPVDCSGDFGPRGLSVQYTQDVRGCPAAHTGRLCVSVGTHRTSVAVRVCLCVSVCVCQHTQDVRVCSCVSLSTQDVRGCPSTQDVRGCPPAHIGRLWLSVAVRLCPCVSVSTHRTSVAVHQYTYQHVGPWTRHADPSRGLFR